MKTFDQLTTEQKVKAIAEAEWDLEESIDMGLVESNKPLSKQDIKDLAKEAAEGGMYNDDGSRLETGFDE